MDWDEINGVIWKYLADVKEEKTVTEIIEDMGFSDKESVLKSVSSLSNIKIISKNKNNGKIYYKAELILTSVKWARAAEIGVPVEYLELYAKLESGDRDDTLKIVADGTLNKHIQDEINEKTQKRKDYVYGRAATEAAATDLAKILKHSSEALKEWKNKEREEGLSLKDKYVTSLLEQTHNEMKRSYNILINGLVRKSL